MQGNQLPLPRSFVVICLMFYFYQIVCPLRAKHCSTCDRCVEQFDHHCPWVSNCIGKKNKWDFFIFLVLEVLSMLITGSVSLTRLLIDHPMAPSSFGAWLNHAGTQHVGAIMFLVAHFFLCSGVTVLTVTQASQQPWFREVGNKRLVIIVGSSVAFL
ncbi:unnamed protein product [Cuscuta campestris]|uniref:S-acyltransferase n=1 Tax=Cuscuta campestris TaxID=132261 RepID=A0A484N5X4_9ASTE|nr:unnamed protein product [Cuscuta campestris]